ncbi:hypothetical protein K0M31_012564 [Melipona bicolor]|uniref:Uncharacterized protein n=1 Tax=Melipona bicolor TaxID=60889 RepID=A0AA40FJI0_9HYME|nr:hypothetical protein K0M31_012564 [Melipona bicolor]
MSAGNLIVLSLLLSLSVGVTSSFKKCCPFGEVFSGISSVNCTQAPPRATQVFLSNLDNRSITYGKLPVCEKVEDITTLSLDELTSTEIVQLQDFCLEILHNETSKNNVATLVLCNSNEDKDPEYSLSKSSPLSQLLNVRRCCLNNAVFDVKTGECELDDYYLKTDHFLPVLTNYLGRDKSHIHDIKPILVHRGLPECTLGAIFTYEIDAADIVFENGTLKKRTENSISRQMGRGSIMPIVGAAVGYNKRTDLQFIDYRMSAMIIPSSMVRDITNLKQRITDATIDEGMLQRTWREIEYHLDVLRATNGSHID